MQLQKKSTKIFFANTNILKWKCVNEQILGKGSARTYITEKLINQNLHSHYFLDQICPKRIFLIQSRTPTSTLTNTQTLAGESPRRARSAHSQQLDSNREPQLFERKSLTTNLQALLPIWTKFGYFSENLKRVFPMQK